MPEDLKLLQIGSSQLPPPFRGLHSPSVRKHCQIIFACYFWKLSIVSGIVNIKHSVSRTVLWNVIWGKEMACFSWLFQDGSRSDTVWNTERHSLWLQSWHLVAWWVLAISACLSVSSPYLLLSISSLLIFPCLNLVRAIHGIILLVIASVYFIKLKLVMLGWRKEKNLFTLMDNNVLCDCLHCF